MLYKHTITTTPQPGVIFIPDISGFTRFVNETDVTHSQHIIAELLEETIQATGDTFEISELEGDAVYAIATGITADALASWLREGESSK